MRHVLRLESGRRRRNLDAREGVALAAGPGPKAAFSGAACGFAEW